MARALSAAAKAAREAELDYSGYKDKAPSDLQERFADWIVDKVGVAFGTKKEEAAFNEGVRLAVALRMKFQASPENQDAIAERAVERAKEEAEAAATVPAKKAVKKAAPAADAEPEEQPVRRPAKKAAAKKAAAPVAEAEEEAEEVSEPVRRPARRPAKRTPAKTDAADAPF